MNDAEKLKIMADIEQSLRPGQTVRDAGAYVEVSSNGEVEFRGTLEQVHAYVRAFVAEGEAGHHPAIQGGFLAADVVLGIGERLGSMDAKLERLLERQVIEQPETMDRPLEPGLHITILYELDQTDTRHMLACESVRVPTAGVDEARKMYEENRLARALADLAHQTEHVNDPEAGDV